MCPLPFFYTFSMYYPAVIISFIIKHLRPLRIEILKVFKLDFGSGPQRQLIMQESSVHFVLQWRDGIIEAFVIYQMTHV